MTQTINSIEITSPARLHLGFIDLNGSQGRKFGSVGLTIDTFFTKIKVTHIERTKGQINSNCERSKQYAKQFCKVFSIESSFTIDVESNMPEHSGFGSGTQLALCVGKAISELSNLNLTIEKIAEILDRGNRSGIGIGSYLAGGFLVDGGKGISDKAPPIIARHDFPENWRIVLLIARKQEGMFGSSEKEAFNKLDVFPLEKAQFLSQLVLMKTLPSLIEKDFHSFTSSISILQHEVGYHFSDAQGGVFSNKKVSEIISFLEKKGFKGMGQSSWGPTGFVLCDSDTQAYKVSQLISKNIDLTDIDLQIVKAKNNGASEIIGNSIQTNKNIEIS